MEDKNRYTQQQDSLIGGVVNPPILVADRLCKSYATGDGALTVLDSVSFELHEGETCSIVGPSGSGKTTLLGLCAGLDQCSGGAVRLAGENLNALSENRLARLRGDTLGFVFQNFQLIPTLTALENVMVPLELMGRCGENERAADLLDAVGLGSRTSHYPHQLSGGEQQRVALARAFVHGPRLLLADEPTGNLDAATSGPIEDMLFELNREHGAALLIVTHDSRLAGRCGRVLRMNAGRLVGDESSK